MFYRNKSVHWFTMHEIDNRILQSQFSIISSLTVNFIVQFLHCFFIAFIFSSRILLWYVPTPMYCHTRINVLNFCYINKPADIIHMQYVIRVLSVVFDWQLNQLGVAVRLRLISRILSIFHWFTSKSTMRIAPPIGTTW